MTSPHVGLIGCGRWGRLIARDLQSLGAIVHIAEPAPSDDARSLAGPRLTSSVDGLPSDLDAYFVATPASTHAEVLMAVLEHGSASVYVEKPFVTDTADARKLHDAHADRLRVLHTWRHHPGVHAIDELVRSGTIGEPTVLHTDRCNWTSPRTDVDALWTLVPHDLSIALQLFGAVPFVEAATLEFGTAGSVVGGHLLASIDGGPKVTTRFSTRSIQKERTIRVHGDDGVVEFGGDHTTELVVARGHEPHPKIETHPFSAESAMIRQLRACLRHATASGRSEPPGSSTAESCRIVEAVERIRSLDLPSHRSTRPTR